MGGGKAQKEKMVNLYNLQKNIEIYKNILDDGNIEFSAQYMNNSGFYCLIGFIEENEFDKLVKNLNYFN